MNISTFVGIILVVSVVFLGFGLIVTNLEQDLIDTGYINTTPFSDTYQISFNQTAEIEEAFNDTVTGLQGLGQEQEWWEQLGDFVGAIPVIIIEFPVVLFITLNDARSNIVIILNEMGIPPSIVVIATLGLVIWIIFKLINFWKSGKEI